MEVDVDGAESGCTAQQDSQGPSGSKNTSMYVLRGARVSLVTIGSQSSNNTLKCLSVQRSFPPLLLFLRQLIRLSPPRLQASEPGSSNVRDKQLMVNIKVSAAPIGHLYTATEASEMDRSERSTHPH